MSEPIVLVINYDENNKSPNPDKVDYIFSQINDIKPDIFILTTQNSRSGTDSHIQHSIRDKINKSKSRKFFRSNTELELLLKKYNLFSKIDATRRSNSKLAFFKDEKPYNVRTRIWINSENVYQGFTKNFSANNYTSAIVKANPSTNENHNTSVGTEKYNPTNVVHNNMIKIEDYSYKRTTASGENGKQGHGSIMISICLIDKNNKNYQYIIGNINPKGSLQENAAGTKKVFFDMIKEGNVIRYLTTVNPEKPFKGQIFILYISKDNCLYKKIEDNTVNNITTLSTITNLNGKKTINEGGLKFYQMDRPINEVNKRAVVPVSANNIQNNGNNYYDFYINKLPNKDNLKSYDLLFMGLKLIIKDVIKKCDKPINKVMINDYMGKNYDYIMNILNQVRVNTKYFPKEFFKYKFILGYLKIVYDIYSNKKDEVSKYIELWELSGETYNNKETTKQLKLDNLLKELRIII